MKKNNDILIERILTVIQYGTFYQDDELFKLTEHNDYLEYKESLEELMHDELVAKTMDVKPGGYNSGRITGPTFTDQISLTIKGKRIKESGGWIKEKRLTKVKNITNWSISIGTFVLAGVGVYLQLNPSDKQSDKTGTSNTTVQEEKIIPSDTLPKSTQSIQRDSVTDSLP
jgi:hypothetical protein